MVKKYLHATLKLEYKVHRTYLDGTLSQKDFVVLHLEKKNVKTFSNLISIGYSIFLNLPHTCHMLKGNFE